MGRAAKSRRQQERAEVKSTAPATQNLGYSQHGASRVKKSMQSWQTALGGPDSDITLNLPLLRQRSRDLFIGEPIAGGALRTIRLNEVGSGLRLNAQIDAKYLGLTDEQALEWEEHTEREWCLWADSVQCDAARRANFGELQALARLSQLMSGDVFVMLPAIQRPGDRYDLKVRLLEADRVCDPWPYPIGKNVLGGVEVGEHGEPVAYHVARRHPGDMIVPSLYGVFGAGDGAFNVGPIPPISDVGVFGAQWNKWDRVPAFGAATGRRLVLHLMESERPGQRRGVPILAVVMERLKQLSRYHEAEITAAVVAGLFTAAITSEMPDAMPGPSIPIEQQLPGITASSGQGTAPDPNTLQLAPGSMLGLLPGEKIESVNPGRPNAGFDPFVKSICRSIAAGLPGLTYGLLMKEFNASYSASRAELLEAWKSFVVSRRAIAMNLCQPTYEQWLEEAVILGYIEAPGFFSDPLVRAAWCGAEWSGPAQGQLDPTKEAEAAEKRVGSGFSTRTQETAQMTGGNWERNHRVRVREERLRREGNVIPATTAAPIAPRPTTDADGEPAVEPAKQEQPA